jgi:hypothetical protein
VSRRKPPATSLLRAARNAALVALLLPASCATVVIPPAAPVDRQAVFLLDHGRSSSLVLPRPDGRAVRYAYGDWAWYALGRTGVTEGSAALLWPSRAALGRRELPGPPAGTVIREQVAVEIDRLYELTVERADVERLAASLEATYEMNLHTRVHNPAADLEFVHHPRAYTALHNSNTVVAGWLRDLGCRVEGPRLFASWRVRPPDTTSAPDHMATR